MVKTLHVVDRESAGGTIRISSLAKGREILRWRDALYSGPVPSGLSLRQLSRLRSRYWTKGRRSTEFDTRDAAVSKHREFEKIVLWFGPGCALCHLSMAQLLSWFREQGVATEKLSWVPVHGGILYPEHVQKAYTTRRALKPAQIRLAERFWRAFRQDSPADMVRLLEGDLDNVSGLRSALMWLLQEYPRRRNGLSRLQTQLLRQIHSRGKTKVVVAVANILARDWVGDQFLFDMLRGLILAEHPLLEFAEPFGGRVQSWKFNAAELALTEIGAQVLSGKVDAIEINGIDRWIGGVHLKGRNVKWRWDEKLRTIVGDRHKLL